MKAILKKPGEPAEICEVENSLKGLQEAVGGYIETFSFHEHFCVICNEEGRILGLPYNLTFLGVPFVGPVLFVGVSGDQFRDITEKGAKWLMKWVK